MFFFEKKKQKTFSIAMCTARQHEKVSCFFFSEKQRLPFLWGFLHRTSR